MRTLAVYHKQLGDTLLLQPALAKLAREDGSPVGLITRPGFADLVSLMPGVVPHTASSAPRAERLFAYDAGDRSTFASWRARAETKTLLTFSVFYRRFFHPWVFDHLGFHDQGQAYRGRYFWDVTPGPVDGFEPPTLNSPPTEWRHPQVPERPFVLVHPTSAWQTKCWPAKPWREVLTALRSLTDMPLVLTGGTSDWESGLCAEIAEGDKHVLNLGGQTSIRQVIAAASQAALVLTVDGFMSHLALAYRKPCITLFGPTNANHWHLATQWSEAIYDGEKASAKTKTLEAIPAVRVIESAGRWLSQAR